MAPTITNEHKTDLVIQRDLLEYRALYSIEINNLDGFDYAVCQLKHYYNVLKALDVEVSESPKKYQMIGLYLMYLLATNKLSQFHLEIEVLPPEIVSDSIYISLPVKLEQYLAVGMFHKIFLSSSNIPEPHYTYFMNKLLDTTRDQIGSCIEKAFSELKFDDAARLLFLAKSSESAKILNDFSAKQKWKKDDRAGAYLFSAAAQKAQLNEPPEDPVIKSVKDNLFYAKQLEKIV